MADTLEEIFNNTSLGASELDDGEHTLVSTDANTSYVIKDMNVSNTAQLGKTKLELNGFEVSGITSNATGSLIIPPNSTLKLKTTDYPLTAFKEITYGNYNSTLIYQEAIVDSKGNTLRDAGGYVADNVTQTGNMTDATLTTANNGNKYIHYSANDDNSSQQLYYLQVTGGGTNSQINSQSYRPFGLDGDKAYYMENSNFVSQDLKAYPTGNAFSQTGFSGYSPYTTSSYPRARAAHGFFWYTPSSGYTTSIYAINLSNGAFHKFDIGSGTSSMDNNKRTFVASVDPINDELVLYWGTTSNNEFKQTIYSNWSQIQAIATPYSSLNTHQPTSNIDKTFSDSQYTSSMSTTAMGYLADGGFTYMSTNFDLVLVSKDLEVTGEVGSMSFGGTSIDPNYTFVRKQSAFSAADMASAGISFPTFGIQLLGIKSENV